MKIYPRLTIGIVVIFVSITTLFSQYTLTDADVEVVNGIIQSCSYDFSEQQIIIPNTLDGQTVIGIADKTAGNGVFQEKEITEVEFPNTLEHIGDYAFYGNPFGNVDIDDCPLDTIGSYAFNFGDGDGSGEFYLTNLNSLKVIGEYAFQGCGVIISSTSLDSIGPYTFYEAWVSLDCPAIRYIGEYGCYGSEFGMITQFTNLEYIGDNAFYTQDIYEEVIDLRGLTKLTHIGSGAFAHNYAWYPDVYLYLPSANIEGYNYRWTVGNAVGGSKVYLTDGISATLEPVYSVTFNVGDGKQPVGTAMVNLNVGVQTAQYWNALNTNASGVCVFDNVLADDEISYTIVAYNFDEYNGSLSVVDSDVEENVILSPIPHDVIFTVTDGTNPLEGATVTLTGYDSQTSDASGNVTISDVNPEENIAYIVEAEGYNTSSGTVTVFDIDIYTNVSLELTKYTVTFSVTDGTNPVESAVVTLSSTAKATDASGIVAFPDIAPEEGIAYTVIANGYDSYAGTISVVDQEFQVDVVLPSTVGISELKNNSVKIYPNPASNRLFIDFLDGNFGKKFVKIIDLTGKTVIKNKLENQSTGIDISDVSHKGLYFIQIIDLKGSIIYGQKLIIQ